MLENDLGSFGKNNSHCQPRSGVSAERRQLISTFSSSRLRPCARPRILFPERARPPGAATCFANPAHRGTKVILILAFESAAVWRFRFVIFIAGGSPQRPPPANHINTTPENPCVSGLRDLQTSVAGGAEENKCHGRMHPHCFMASGLPPQCRHLFKSNSSTVLDPVWTFSMTMDCN